MLLVEKMRFRKINQISKNMPNRSLNPDSYIDLLDYNILYKEKIFIPTNLKILKSKFENLSEMDSFLETCNSLKLTQEKVANY